MSSLLLCLLLVGLAQSTVVYLVEEPEVVDYPDLPPPRDNPFQYLMRKRSAAPYVITLG